MVWQRLQVCLEHLKELEFVVEFGGIFGQEPAVVGGVGAAWCEGEPQVSQDPLRQGE